ncbi:MAG: dTDP-4-dehydrorhamnose 3,5-epimerase [Deltaproteobacteria bacterium]
MKVEFTAIDGIIVFSPDVFYDERGYFFESFSYKKFRESTGLDLLFVQDNESFSKFGVLRGLHYQLPPFEQGKLIRVIKGKVYDVAVDIRPGSKSFGQYFGIELTDDNKKQVYIPPGFAHGFVTLSETAVFSYKCTNYYDKASEAGIKYDDKYLGINWLIEHQNLIVSDKDKNLPPFEKHAPYGL